MNSARDDQIRMRAYELWEAEGRPHGKKDEHWARAVRELEEATAEPSLANDPAVDSDTLALGTKAPKAPGSGAAKEPVKRAKPAADSAPKSATSKSPKPKSATPKSSAPKAPTAKSKPKK